MKDLLAAIESQEALASRRGSLAEDRLDALDHYLGRPYGDETEGKSQVVMRDVADTIDWILPSLMEVFGSGDEVCRFDPTGPEDEQQAEQETDYISHVVMQQNDGFIIFHDWFKDALRQKNGYVMAQPCKIKTSKKDRYQGLSDDEWALLNQSAEVEVLEHTAYPGAMGLMHDAVIRRSYEKGQSKITNVPPERVLVASDWPHIHFRGCPFLEVIDYKTISDLRQDGFDVDDDLSDTGDSDEDKWAEQRRDVEGDEYVDRESLGADKATKRLRVRYVWMMWDSDGDGIAELRKIVVVGKTILEDEEDALIPVAALTPFREPHEHYGQSVHDLVGHLQRIHTVLMRGYLDNTYLANNGRNAINAENVNLDDMLQSRPGGVVRVKGNPSENIAPLLHPMIGESILQAMEKIDQVRERTTGVNKNTQGLESDALEKTALEARQLMSAAQMKMKMIARVFAETGVKDLMLIVHAVTMKNGRQAEIVKLRNQWVPVDPSTWSERTNMTVSVGLGTGNRDQQSAFLLQILGVQKEALMMGVPITTPQHVYRTLKKLSQHAGFKNPDDFWQDPEKAPPQPPRPDPEQIKAQAALQVEQMKGQTTIQVEREKAQLKAQTDVVAQQAQGEQATQQQQLQAQLEMEKARLQAALEEQKLRHTAELEAMKLQADREKNIRDNQVKLAIAGMKPKEDGSGGEDPGPSTSETAIMELLGMVKGLHAEMGREKTVVRGKDGRVSGLR